MEHPAASGTPRIHIVRAAPHGVPVSGPGCLGVLGGAYNPITNAHLAIADTVVRTFGLHEVLFLLPEVPPHKTIFGASLDQRLEMMHLAVEERTYAAVGLSTHGLFLDMYQGLLGVYPPHTEIFFLTGRDAAERILTWKYDDAAVALRQMFTAFQLIVCDRDGPFHLPDDPLLAPYQQRIHCCTLPPGFNHVSATEVRQRCRQGLPLDDLVPAKVAHYIGEHELYVE